MKYGVWVISHLKTSMEERYVASYICTITIMLTGICISV